MTLKLFSSTRSESELLNDKTLNLEHMMVDDQHRYLLGSSGLQPFLDVLHIRTRDVYLPM